MKRYALIALCGGLIAGSAMAGETFYVSKVAKGSVNTFLNRFATPTHQIVVTKAAPKAAEEVLTINVEDGETLVVRELNRPDTPTLSNEKARLDRFALIVQPAMALEHSHADDNPLDYLEHVATEETTVEPIAAPMQPEAALESSADVLPAPIDESFLRTKLAQYSGEESVTIDGKATTIKERGSAGGRRAARAFLAQEYRALGFTVSEDAYGSGANFVAEKAGSDPSKVLIVSAHLDSMSNAGADDDGTGTISALALANAVKDMNLRHTLRVVGFDEEERGLLGSSAYVRTLRTRGELTNLIGVLNLEMTGFDGDNDGAVHVIDCNENTSATLTAQVMAGVGREGVALRKADACTNRSDHAAFWRYSVPAIVVSQNFFGGDSNPCYHRSCDKMDKVNFSYMKNITTAVTSAAIAILGPQ